MSDNDWTRNLIDDTTDVLDAVLPARFVAIGKALVETTLTTLPLGAQLTNELASRGPVERSGTVERDDANVHGADERGRSAKAGRS